MQQREFIGLVCGAAAGWPLAARAQQPRSPVIGWLDNGAPADVTANLATFKRALSRGGYSEGQNLASEHR